MAEQGPYKAEVPGSSPGAPNIRAISSVVEHSLDVRRVRGSSPLSPTMNPVRN